MRRQACLFGIYSHVLILLSPSPQVEADKLPALRSRMFILQAGAAEARQLEKLMTDYGKQEVLLQRLKDQEQEVQVTIIRIRIDLPPFSPVPDPPPIHPYVYSPFLSLYIPPSYLSIYLSLPTSIYLSLPTS